MTLDEAKTRAAVSIREAASLLGIGETTAKELVRQGRIPSVRLGVSGKRGRVVVPVEPLLAMLRGDELKEVAG